MRLADPSILFATVAAAVLGLGCDGEDAPASGTTSSVSGTASSSASVSVSSGATSGQGGAGGAGGEGGAGGGVGEGGAGGAGGGAGGGSAGAALWSVRLGGPGEEDGRSVALDSAGAAIVTGSGMFFTGLPTSLGGRDIPLGKLDASGALVWAHQFFCDGGNPEDFSQIATSGTDIFLATRCDGSVDFGGGELTGPSEIAVARFDADGNHVWSKKIGGVGTPYSVAVNGSGHLLVAGTATGDSDFGGGLLPANGPADAFVVDLDAQGTHVWSKLLGGPNGAGAWSVAVDGSDAVYVSGSFVGSADFGGGALVSAGGYDLFLVKLDGLGNHSYSKRFGDAGHQRYGVAAVLPSGDAVLSAPLEGSIDFGGGALSEAKSGDFGVARLGADGSHVWSKRMEGDSTKAMTVATDAAGNIFLAGGFSDTLDLGGPPLFASSGVYVGKLDGSGAHVWSWAFDTVNNNGDQAGASIAADPSGVVVIGWFGGTIEFGNGPMTSAGSYDAFVAKLPL